RHRLRRERRAADPPAAIDHARRLIRRIGRARAFEHILHALSLGQALHHFHRIFAADIDDRVGAELFPRWRFTPACGRCQRCREGMYTSCLNYGYRAKGHRANGFSTDGGFAGYAVNNINTLAHIPDEMSDAEATLVVTAGTAMYGL